MAPEVDRPISQKSLLRLRAKRTHGILQKAGKACGSRGFFVHSVADPDGLATKRVRFASRMRRFQTKPLLGTWGTRGLVIEARGFSGPGSGFRECVHGRMRCVDHGVPVSVAAGSPCATLMNQGSYPMSLDSTLGDPDRAPRFVSALRLPKVLTLWGGTVASAYIDWDNSPDGADSNSWGKNLASTEGRITPRRIAPVPRLPAMPARCSPRRRSRLPRSGATRAGGRPRFWRAAHGFLDVDPMILIKSDHLLNDVVALPVAGMAAIGFTAGHHLVGDPGESVAHGDVDLGCGLAREFLDPRLEAEVVVAAHEVGVGDPQDGLAEPAISLGDQGPSRRSTGPLWWRGDG